MSSDQPFYSHSIRSPVAASTSATPYGGDTPRSAPHHQQQQQLARRNGPLQRSLLKQEILTEEEYVHQLSEIIKRDFFPALRSLEGQHDILAAYESEDPQRIEESVRRMREICTPTPRRRNRANTPGRTPFATSPSATPAHFDATPDSRFTSSSRPSSRHRPASPPPRIDPTLSLDAFQSTYTSEDNSSFAVLLARDNAARREKYSWAWDAETRAKQKQIRGREARERLVDVTRRMVESSEDGVVRLLEGKAGRPAEMRLIVEGEVAERVKIGEGDRLMIEGKSSGEGGGGRLLIEAPGAPDRLSEIEMATRKQKARGGVRKEDGDQFEDWDKATAEEKEENKAPRREEMQVPIDSWGFTNRNSFMFPPDADVDPTNPSTFASLPSSATTSISQQGGPILPPSEPKGVRYHATRLEKLEKGASLDSLSSLGGSSVVDGGSSSSPSRSRIGAAIAGTPYPAPSSGTPRVSGFSFVSALPSPVASSLPASSLQELMTWGTIEATPVTLRSSGEDGAGGGPFKIKDTSRREKLAVEMGRRAKRALSDRAGAGSGSSSSAGASRLGLGGSGGGLRRSVLDSPARGGGRTTPGSTTPRDLSPAASALLGRTGQGRALAHGLAQSRGWEEEEKEKERRRKVERAKQRAREVESRERLRRERWTASPAVSLGFDPEEKEVEEGFGSVKK